MTTWEQVLKKLEPKINPHTFRTWFRPTKQRSEEDGRVVVEVPTLWFAEWLRTNYISLIHDTLHGALAQATGGATREETGPFRALRYAPTPRRRPKRSERLPSSA